MFIFPTKILPALLVIGGLIMMMSDEASMFSIIVTIVGCVWSYYSYFKKD